jgi:uncharacterized protein YdhG (YjbR/CyaY superfamily)
MTSPPWPGLILGHVETRRPGMATTKKPSTVREYLAGVPPKERAVLEKIRRAVLSVAPDAGEKISYGIPTFTYNGRHLVYYAAMKKHLSFFPGSKAVLRQFASELEPFDTKGPGTVRFSVDKPLPMTLVKKIVRARMKENEARTGGYGRSKPNH